jgi:hypothetical protein
MQSLQNICLDSIILSDDPDVIKSVIDLPSYILKMIDRRDVEICCNKKYKQRFYSLDLDCDDKEEDDEELSDYYMDYDEEDSYEGGEEEPWFDPDDFC